jgi:hypothetical protein
MAEVAVKPFTRYIIPSALVNNSLELRTKGCDCCSENRRTDDPATAVEWLLDAAESLRHEAEKLEHAATIIDTTGKIPDEWRDLGL